MISIAITNYNRSGWTVESFIEVLNNDYVNEIVIMDDYSDDVSFNNLNAIIKAINNPKIKLLRNTSNYGVYRNKQNAVGACSNEWVILFDSDNIIGNDYIEKIRVLDKDETILYCPEIPYDTDKVKVQWDYSEVKNILIDRNNVDQHIYKINFQISLNTGNNFFNKNTYFKVIETVDDLKDKICGCDAIYFSYLWLLRGYKIKVVEGLGYIHRMHDKSFYLTHINEAREFTYNVLQKIKELCPDITPEEKESI